MSPVRARVISALAVSALGVACAVWAAVPLGPGSGDRMTLGVALAAIAFGGLRLATAAPRADEIALGSGAGWVWSRARALAHAVPWTELAVVAALLLEVMHPARPWHTAALGAAVLVYVFGTHLAESQARPASLRPQLPLLLAGAGLLVLAATAGALPAVAAAPAWLRVLAAAAAVIASVLLVPA